MKHALILLALMFCWAGCSKTSPPPSDKEAPPPAATEPQTVAPVPQPEAPPPAPAPAPTPTPQPEPPAVKAAAVEQPPAGMKVCFECDGTGEAVCNALGCTNGLVACSGPCLKLSQGNWQHMHMEGYSDEDLWQIFTNDDGTRKAVNQALVGHVLELQNGTWADAGKCRICDGTTKVKCSACNGTGKLLCRVCEGQKFVPEQWTAFNNPKQKNPPRTIHLKDGTTLFGKLEGQVGSTIYVRTENGKQVTLDTADIVSP